MARKWNSASMRIRPPHSLEPSASEASKWNGVDDGLLPSVSHRQMLVAAIILEGGCRETSSWIHMNLAGGHVNSASGYVMAERPLSELSMAWLSSLIHPLPTAVDWGENVLYMVARQRRASLGWVEGREVSHPCNGHLVLYLLIYNSSECKRTSLVCTSMLLFVPIVCRITFIVSISEILMSHSSTVHTE